MKRLIRLIYFTTPEKGLIESRWDQTCYVFSMIIGFTVISIYGSLCIAFNQPLSATILGGLLFGSVLITHYITKQQQGLKHFLELQTFKNRIVDRLVVNCMFYGCFVIMIIVLSIARDI